MRTMIPKFEPDMDVQYVAVLYTMVQNMLDTFLAAGHVMHDEGKELHTAEDVLAASVKAVKREFEAQGVPFFLEYPSTDNSTKSEASVDPVEKRKRSNNRMEHSISEDGRFVTVTSFKDGKVDAVFKPFKLVDSPENMPPGSVCLPPHILNQLRVKRTVTVDPDNPEERVYTSATRRAVEGRNQEQLSSEKSVLESATRKSAPGSRNRKQRRADKAKERKMKK